MIPWRSLPAEHRRWIVINSVIATAIFNFVLNLLLAWLSVRGEDEGLELWSSEFGEASMIADAIGTAAILPFVTCLITVALVRREMKHGEITPLDPSLPQPSWVHRVPPRLLRRALWFGAITAVLVGPIWVLALAIGGVEHLSTGCFALYKALACVGLGAIVTPFIAYSAMVLGQERA